ncbi:alanine racemase [Gilvimarinus sp. SDUM040013]|uniref:Alanine racemase n=1 Tax=Gilvimarinus gilvus TaxID=3058038 RepID=A0ABU4S2L1_9GAMM|nr:alanine racemase [Gilvimarinus sp. SDUM040013]MDO3385510.1 alanine racemase [Gilvimarinus sp. SDUM040013]MDX6851412.1 alanine racemase [Gilvimarinus sp. SDUM040013]
MSVTPPGLSIDLSALVANWRALAELSAPAVTSAVVKADAYGLGVEPVAKALHSAGCRHYFVATLDEARQLAHCLDSDIRCYVLGGAPLGLERECASLGVTPVLCSLSAIRRWRAAGLAGRDCAVKIDTGMSRQGLGLAELDDLLAAPALLRELNPSLVMSHLACADEPHHPQNSRQLAEFRAREAALRQVLPNCRLSLANSCGIYLGKEYHFDLVRPGAALYGFQPPQNEMAPAESIRPVLTLALPTLQFKRLEVDSSVGYGATYNKPQGAILAVCAGGYADGVHNILQSQGVGELSGVEVPVAGRISMDITTFDVTAVPNVEQWLDSVDSLPAIQIINRSLTLNRLTQERHLLGYELLTTLRGSRCPRVYRGEV